MRRLVFAGNARTRRRWRPTAGSSVGEMGAMTRIADVLGRLDGTREWREELYARIDARIEAMFEAGLLDEVRGLLAQGYPSSLPTMSAIGYRECVRVIKGEWSIEQAKIGMRRATRVYVRRQGNWFKESDPGIHWFRVGPGTVDEIEALVRSAVTNG